jgi:ssDNA-binding Zn-finger/Zn-ribbon topoisomerase 1
MQLSSKFNLGQTVWKIAEKPSKTFIPCPSCGGDGFVILKNGRRSCPDCYGNKGRIEYGTSGFEIVGHLTIGEVRVYARNFKKSGIFNNIGSYCIGTDSFKVEYMCYETGIRSGSIHYEDTLFDSKESALFACNERNSCLRSDS